MGAMFGAKGFGVFKHPPGFVFVRGERGELGVEGLQSHTVGVGCFAQSNELVFEVLQVCLEVVEGGLGGFGWPVGGRGRGP